MKARTDLLKLRSFADRLGSLVAQMIDPGGSLDDQDHLGFMALCFVGAQMEHVRSVCVLVDNGQDRDAALVARTMIEGLCQLKWAAQKPSARPEVWRAYSLVEDWRLMRSQSDEEVDQPYRQKIEQRLSQYGPGFWSDKARKRKSEGKRLPADPYRRDWHGQTALQIFEDVDGKSLYERIYRVTSGWIHWNPKAIGTALERSSVTVDYTIRSPNNAATALAGSFQALFESAQLLNNHFDLGYSDQLEKLYIDYSATMNVPQNVFE